MNETSIHPIQIIAADLPSWLNLFHVMLAILVFWPPTYVVYAVLILLFLWQRMNERKSADED